MLPDFEIKAEILIDHRNLDWQDSGEGGWNLARTTRIQHKTARSRPIGRKTIVLARIRPFWQDLDQMAGSRPLWWLESGDSDRTLSDFGTNQISMVVDYLNLKVDCIV